MANVAVSFSTNPLIVKKKKFFKDFVKTYFTICERLEMLVFFKKIPCKFAFLRKKKKNPSMHRFYRSDCNRMQKHTAVFDVEFLRRKKKIRPQSNQISELMAQLPLIIKAAHASRLHASLRQTVGKVTAAPLSCQSPYHLHHSRSITQRLKEGLPPFVL